jgi:signal transduction histidine kinase
VNKLTPADPDLASEASASPVPRDQTHEWQSSRCAGAASGGQGAARLRRGRSGTLRSLIRRKPSRLLIPLAVLCTFTVLFIGWEVAERHLFPAMSLGLRHALLTVRAAVVTIAASTIVFLLMRRQQRRLSTTAEQLSRLLETRQRNPSEPVRFKNPYLVRCREVAGCGRANCPMYESLDERCWQAMALRRAALDAQPTAMEIEHCHDCAVYRLSCPDKLTELGESFNDLMFLLEEEAKRVGRMRAQMVEKEKMVAIGQIAAGVAHEVGNPLSSISSIVQMLKRHRPSASSSEALGLIETHVQRITTIVRQLVTLARPEVEQWELVSTDQIVAGALRLTAFDRRARKVEIDFEQRASSPKTYGLRGQLEQVFINLSLNALDAMPDGGKLSVRTEVRRGYILVLVRDTGSGIAPEVGRRVFEPFFTTKEPGHGTGLGLAVSYGIIQKHGGSIDFSSTPGQGTVFTVGIPILNKQPEV